MGMDKEYSQEAQAPTNAVAMLETEAELAFAYWQETATEAQKANFESAFSEDVQEKMCKVFRTADADVDNLLDFKEFTFFMQTLQV